MKKKNEKFILIALFALALGIFSCLPDEDHYALQEPQETKENTQKASSQQRPRLAKITIYLLDDIGTGLRYETVFNYNANGQLVKIHFSSSYYSKEINFFYSNSLLDSIGKIEETEIGIIKEKGYKFSYKNGGLKEVNEYYFKNDIWDNKIKYLITTDSQGRIVTVKSPTNTDIYEYDENGNISKIKHSNATSRYTYTRHTYTDKPNPFSNLPIINFGMIYSNIEAVEAIDIGEFMQPNNNLMESLELEFSETVPFFNSNRFLIYWLNSSEYNYQGYPVSSFYYAVPNSQLLFYYKYE